MTEWYQKITNQDSFKVGVAIGMLFFFAQAIKEILIVGIKYIPFMPIEIVTIVSYLITAGILLWQFSSLVTYSKK